MIDTAFAALIAGQGTLIGAAAVLIHQDYTLSRDARRRNAQRDAEHARRAETRKAHTR